MSNTRRRFLATSLGFGTAASLLPATAAAGPLGLRRRAACQSVIWEGPPVGCNAAGDAGVYAVRQVQFGRVNFELVQGAITVQSVSFMVSKTAETIGSPGLIKFMPLFSGFQGQETSLGINCVFAPVCFDVDFPYSGIFYRWVDVTYRYRAGSTNEVRHAYLDLQGFNV